MSLVHFFNSPIYDDFDRLFDEAFSRRTAGGDSNQVSRQGNGTPRVFRPS